MNKEIWKDIKGYEELYQVSNLGNVRSLDRYVKQLNNNTIIERIYKGKILKNNIASNGYSRVVLQNRKPKTFLVHRLVAEAFIPNPNNYLYINHKDEDKTNNHASNLEWCTQSYNINYGKRNELVRLKLKSKPKSTEHRNKLSIAAKNRIIIRDTKGQIVNVKKKEVK